MLPISDLHHPPSECRHDQIECVRLSKRQAALRPVMYGRDRFSVDWSDAWNTHSIAGLMKFVTEITLILFGIGCKNWDRQCSFSDEPRMDGPRFATQQTPLWRDNRCEKQCSLQRLCWVVR